MKFFNLLGRFVSKYWYTVIAFWVLLTIGLFFAAPNLSDLLSSDQGDLLPQSSPSVVAKKVIENKFNKNEYKTSAIIAIENKDLINKKDREYIKSLSKWLESTSKPKEVSKVISTATNPELVDNLNSKDKKATMIIVGFNTGSSAPATYKAIDKIREHIKEGPKDLKLAVTGEATITRDYDATSQEAVKKTTIVTIALVVVILFIIYRSPVAPLIPLITIGISFTVTKSIVAFMAQAGMKIADFTEIFIVVMLFGAGTDYCLFLISRYKEELANGKEAKVAVSHTVEAVGEAISSSAATVIVGMASMTFAQFGMFNKTGPSIAIGVAIALAAGLTLTPALLRVFGRFTFWPVKKVDHLKDSAFWDKISGVINRHPGLVFIVTTLVLLVFASVSTAKVQSYDLFGELPKKVDSVQGYDIFKKHYKQGDMLPVTVVIKAKDNMWSPNSINNVYQLTKNLEKLKYVDSVRSVAQPNGNGKDFEGFLVPNQLNAYADGLRQGSDGLNQINDGLTKMKNGSNQLTGGLQSAANGVDKGRQGSLTMKNGAEKIASGLQSSQDSTTQIASGLGSIQAGIDGTNSTLGAVSNSLGSIANNLGPSNPEYVHILTQKGTLDTILNGNPTIGVPKFSDLSKGLQDSKAGLNSLAQGQGDMISGQKGIVSGLGQSADGSATLSNILKQMAGGSNQLTDVLAKSSEGVRKVSNGLDQAQDGIDKMSKTQKDSGTGFFYVPQEILDKNQQLKKGMEEYVSNDTKYTKLEIVLKDKPYSDEAIKHVGELRGIISRYEDDSNFNTPKLYIGGTNALVSDMKTLIDSDYIRMLYLVVAGVFIILVLLMRSVLSPIYLVLTILLSYIATMGITVILFQYILGQPGLDWKVPIFMFIILVALGEDYNILLMSRVKEETAQHGVNEGVRQAVKKTGGIITSAGVIMAGTFGALMVTPLMSMVQLGFAIAFGVLMDTFIVRPILVPAIIILLNKLAVRLQLKPAETTITK